MADKIVKYGWIGRDREIKSSIWCCFDELTLDEIYTKKGKKENWSFFYGSETYSNWPPQKIKITIEKVK